MFFLFLSGTLHAAIQKTIHFQGFLTDSNDEAVMDNTYQMTFSLWDDSDDATATKIWEETRSIAVSRGIYSVNLGELSGNWVGPNKIFQRIDFKPK